MIVILGCIVHRGDGSINKNNNTGMPRFTIVEGRAEGQPGRKSKDHAPVYVQQLRQVLQNSRRNSEPDQRQTLKHHSQSPVRKSAPEDNEEKADELYVIKDEPEKEEKVRLPKLRKRHRPNRYASIDENQKLIIKNYMNAKLIEFKEPLKKRLKKKSNHKTNQSLETDDKKSKKYYVYRKATPSEFSANYGSQSQVIPAQKQRRLASSRTLKLDKQQAPLRSMPSVLPFPGKIPMRTIKTEGQPVAEDGKSNRINSRTDSVFRSEDLQLRTGIGQMSSEKEEKSLRKQMSTRQIKQQWQKVDPLNMETYFVKLKKIGNTSPQNSQLRPRLQLPRVPPRDQISKFIKSYIPQNDEVRLEEVIKSPYFQIITEQVNGKPELYFGEVDKQCKHGMGILVSERCVFEGEWRGDEKVRGLEKTETGRYRGEFSNGKREGKGEFYWSHGEYYSGEWKNGKKSGSGFWKSEKGESYMGEWNNGEVTGYGVHVIKSGQRYEGQFVNFLKHGFGREAFPNGDVFEGKYENGQPSGNGRYEWRNGIVYEGEFVEGHRTGKGVIIAPHKLEFEGTFRMQMVHGMGKIVYSNGDIFQGIFENNRKNGPGILELKNQKTIIKGVWSGGELLQQQPR